MVANFVLICSIGTFCLAMLDLLLSDAQKRSVAHWMTKVWNFLDGLKRRLKRSPMLRHGRRSMKFGIVASLMFTIVSVLVAGLLWYLLFLFYPDPDVDFPEQGWHLVPPLLLVFGGLLFAGLTLDLFLEFSFWTLVAGFYYSSVGIFLFTELILRRIAEHPKGPIIAISLGLAALAALFKGSSG